MFLFGLSTASLMFGFGFLSGKLNKKYAGHMLAVSAFLIFVMGLHMTGNGLAMSGVSLLPYGRNETIRMSRLGDGVQTVVTHADYGSYESIAVRRGIPVEWTFIMPEEKLNGCNGEIIIPEFGMRVKLSPGENKIRFTPERAGSVPYSCWMGMIKSRITVTE